MALVLGTNSGFVIAAPTAAASGGTAVVIDGSSVVTKDTSPSTATTIVEIGWYRRTGTNTANFEIALYNEAAGIAATRAAVDATNSSSVGPGWIRTAVNWAISGSTAYWLGLQMDAHSGSSDMPREDSGGAGIDLLTSQTALADPYGGGAVIDADGMYAIYALWAPVHAPITGVIAAAAAAGVAGAVSVVNAPVDASVTGVIAAATAAARTGNASVPISAGFELGTIGNTIAAADTGDATKWDNITITGTGTLTYDTAHAAIGSQAAKFTTSTSSAARLEWGLTAFGTKNGTHYGRLYLYVTAFPTATLGLVRCQSGGSLAFQIHIDTSGKIVILDSTSTSRGVSTNAIATGQFVRIEFQAVQSATAGSIQVKLFNTATSTSETETLDSTADINTLASSNQLYFGPSSGANHTGWLDAILGGLGAYPGPDTSPISVQGIVAAAAAAGLPGTVSIVSGSADVSIDGVTAAATAAGVAGAVRFDANAAGVIAAAAVAGAAGTPAVRASGAPAAATAAGAAGAARFDDNLTGVRAAATAAGVAGSVSIISGSTDATITGVTAAASAAGVVGAARFDFNLTGARAVATTAGVAGSFHVDSNLTGVRATATASATVGSITISTPLAGTQATAAAAGTVGTTRFDINLAGAQAAATAAGQPGIVGAATLVTGVRAAATAQAVVPTLLVSTFPVGVQAAAAAVATTGSVRQDANITGVRAVATAAGQAGTVFAGNTVAVTGVQATATATGIAGSLATSYILDGAIATATATAAGSLFITSTILGTTAIVTATGQAGSVFTGGAGFPATTTTTRSPLGRSTTRVAVNRGKTAVLVGASGATYAEEVD